VTIGGANTLTIGTGGITDNAAAAVIISSNVALGTSQTWSNNTANAFTVSGVISGAGGNNLTIGGSGAFTFTGANSYSGSTALFTGTLNVSGASGAIASSSGLSLGAGTILNLDSTAGNHTTQDRIGDSTTITITRERMEANIVRSRSQAGVSGWTPDRPRRTPRAPGCDHGPTAA